MTEFVLIYLIDFPIEYRVERIFFLSWSYQTISYRLLINNNLS